MGQKSSRAQRAVLCTWIRWSVEEGLGSGTGRGREGCMVRVWVEGVKMRDFMVGGRGVGMDRFGDMVGFVGGMDEFRLELCEDERRINIMLFLRVRDRYSR